MQPANEAVRVNLGCGTRGIAGWVNIDRSWKLLLYRLPLVRRLLNVLASWGVVSRESLADFLPGSRVRRHDVTRGLPFRNNSVDFIYTSHMIEHLTPQKARLMLRECHRVLKMGGMLRILTPDLELFVREYTSHGNTGGAAADILMRRMSLHGIGDSRPLLNRLANKRHQWIYDCESLSSRLTGAGFVTVARREIGQGDCPDLELFKEETHPDSLCLEARK